MKTKLNQEIIEFGKKYKKEYAKILKAIKRYDTIVVFRHSKPDYDALGTQMGLATWLKDNFKDKEIHVVGDNHVTFTPRIFPVMDKLNEDWFKQKFLAIIVDVGQAERISDPRFKKSRYRIVLDHHPKMEEVGKINVIDTSMAAASELVVNMLLNLKGDFVFSKEAARYFYIALVGDSGRFMYSSTSKHTFAIAEELISTGIEFSKIYQEMYQKQLDDLKVTAYVLNNFKVSPHGVAYYVLSDQIQKDLKITSERVKENVNVFANIEGINAWCSIAEDTTDNCYRVSIRSKNVPINEIAKKYQGGGHAQASGARLDSLDELNEMIKDLDNLFI